MAGHGGSQERAQDETHLSHCSAKEEQHKDCTEQAKTELILVIKATHLSPGENQKFPAPGA